MSTTRPSFACLDVYYHGASGATATAACVLFDDWLAREPTEEIVREISAVAPYEPGQFYRRELPCLLAVLEALPQLPRILLIDAYVTLDDAGTPGLGARLFSALGEAAAVVGVAKTHYAGAPAIPTFRGASRNPLYVSAVGSPVEEAARQVARMHGEFRLPTLLQRVDRLSRTGASERGA